jgi:hypothetical protein
MGLPIKCWIVGLPIKWGYMTVSVTKLSDKIMIYLFMFTHIE